MIGIISAMPEEMKALLNELQAVESIQKGERTYHTGRLFGKSVVMVFSRWGKVAAAATTTQLISDFNPKEILFTGVAGGIDETLNIGDVVVGNRLYQHDMDARPFFSQFEIPILKAVFFRTANSKKLLNAAKKFIQEYSIFIEKKYQIAFSIHQPKVILGDIASGDTFISSQSKIEELNQSLPTVTCVEMEGAAVAQVCYEYQIPFSIIRTISDKANDNANIDFSKFSNKVASNYALGILKHYFA